MLLVFSVNYTSNGIIYRNDTIAASMESGLRNFLTNLLTEELNTHYRVLGSFNLQGKGSHLISVYCTPELC